MKKLVFMFVAMAAISFASCGNTEKAGGDGDTTINGDTVTAAGDTVTAAGDTVTAAGDTVTAAGDSITAAE